MIDKRHETGCSNHHGASAWFCQLLLMFATLLIHVQHYCRWCDNRGSDRKCSSVCERQCHSGPDPRRLIPASPGGEQFLSGAAGLRCSGPASPAAGLRVSYLQADNDPQPFGRCLQMRLTAPSVIWHVSISTVLSEAGALKWTVCITSDLPARRPKCVVRLAPFADQSGERE